MSRRTADYEVMKTKAPTPLQARVFTELMRKGMTAYALAKAVGMGVQPMLKCLTGDCRISTLRKICVAVGIDALGDESNEIPAVSHRPLAGRRASRGTRTDRKANRSPRRRALRG